ncbi:hypothetical protein VSP53_05885 [Escherichia coli]|nr:MULTISPECIES: hypothetical protein [Enterobacteriaceae]MEC9691023.1 hypothetical protein [Escherichia marmotae]MCC9219383.1 hypothetical protein [Escherichia coli]MCD6751318.1 hypothetical protein [Escherichia coli]MCD6809209.1 hypothetical protein [Escherichia coli]MCD6839293.1 hypothetical protein [Escherichia coli]
MAAANADPTRVTADE